MTTAIIFSILWYVVGMVSFIYWYTKDNDFGLNDLVTCFSLAFYGPVIFFVGWIIHSSSDIQFVKRPNTKILIKRRK
jgi:hypothetical protein